MTNHQVWDLWVPDVAAQGLAFARGRLLETDVLLVHAAATTLDVEVRDDSGTILARGKSLTRSAKTPIARLRRTDDVITRADVWPTEADYGTPVILAGGEVGILQRWWNDPAGQEWRWSLELYNHR